MSEPVHSIFGHYMYKENKYRYSKFKTKKALLKLDTSDMFELAFFFAEEKTIIATKITDEGFPSFDIVVASPDYEMTFEEYEELITVEKLYETIFNSVDFKEKNDCWN